ncbi:RnfABCDGE type electron transport complex subunit B [Schnuerera sp.]|uniref:RnfABCDGE type electron transport complex subunit B n=1 Tax=Schnuerera sp. TaxID=2794844 RepID=UPI002B5D693C|nr:RnfABCDGE type electron transport complex subunit B [Schnuerera sp.]HSH34636.1 RnfABCDGE type electron transport complex subunit B [Schnuerera sp.]
MIDILYPVTVLGGLGLLFGTSLSLASKVFSVEVNPKVEEVRKVLPGANCGACGFPGCDGLANAIAEGKAPVNACSVGGDAVAEKVANIMGVNAAESVREVATVLCQGDCDKAKDKYIYNGIEDCRAQNILSGGSKACSYGCLGCGTCKDVCEFDAIQIINGIAVIDKDKCTACKKCLSVCPKGIIELIPYDNEVVVKCKSNDPGKIVRGNCSTGCIGCQICVKNCPVDAFSFENYLAKINYDKCINCGICAEKCPTNAIFSSLEKSKTVAQ